jgi:GT2 family glycosyltransferase/SAM-dependent methyltransferase
MPLQSLARELKSERYQLAEINLKNQNSSQSLTVELVGENKRVLEIGTSTGYVTKVLRERGNQVIGVEIDKDAGEAARQYCESMIIGDVDELDLDAYIDPASIDVILMADVLEHLRWPDRLLGKIKKYLKQDGYLVVSIPNVAHGDLLLNLLNGDFRYTSMGLLDETHLRFFGRRNIINIFNKLGYIIKDLLETKTPVGSTELKMDSGNMPPELIKFISSLPDSDVYQFVFKAIPSDRSSNEAIPDVDFIKAVSISLEDILKQHESEKVSASEQLKQAHDLAATLGQNISQLLKDIGDRDSRISSISSQLQQVNLEHEAQIAGISSQLKEANSKVLTLVQANAEREAQIAGISSQLQEANSQVLNLEQAKAEREAQIAGISSQLQEANSQVLALEQANAEREAQIASLGSQLQEASSQVLTLEQANAERETQIAGISSQLQEATSQVLTLVQANAEREAHIASINSQLQEATSRVQILNNEISEMKRSIVWQMTMKFHNDFVERALPPGSSQRRFYDRGLKGARILVDEGASSLWKKYQNSMEKNNIISPINIENIEAKDDYAIWIQSNEPNERELESVRNESNEFIYKPKISILTPVWNVDERWLRLAIESVINQTYKNWELCIVDGGSENPNIKKILKEFANQDSRIKVKLMGKNEGISVNSNECLSLSTGQFVVFLDHDDELAAFALYEVVKLLNINPKLEFIYSDHDKMDAMGRRFEPFFKPDWSPDMFLTYNYPIHITVIRKEMLIELGGFRKEYDGSQDYDLFLRVLELIESENIAHIPKILYHWRTLPTSAAQSSEAKPYAYIAAKNALKDAMKRRGIEIDDVLNAFSIDSYRVKYKIENNPKVAIIIPTKDNLNLLRNCINSILTKTTYRNFKIIIVDNQSKRDDVFGYYEELKRNPMIEILNYNKEFNYSEINNYAISQTDSEYILLLNNDVEIISEDWLNAMLEHAQRENVGAVGAKLIFPDNTIQHCGIVLDNGDAYHVYYKHPDNLGYFGIVDIIRNCTGVTAACMLTKRSIFNEVGGLDEDFAVAFNDVDYCFKLRQKGYLIVYTPYAKLYHHESQTRGQEDVKQLRFLRERDELREKWIHVMDMDPYLNPNLTLIDNGITIKKNEHYNNDQKLLTIRVDRSFVDKKLPMGSKRRIYYNTAIDGVRRLRNDGPKISWRKAKNYIADNLSTKKKAKAPISRDASCLKSSEHVPIDHVRIAVIAHVYYIDLIEEICSFLKNIPIKYTLLISTCREEDRAIIIKHLDSLPFVEYTEVKVVENRGRDFAPMFVDFAPLMENFDYICHIHTKKSLYCGVDRIEWRQYLYEMLLGSRDRVQAILNAFESDPSVGVIYPETFDGAPYWAHTWLSNKGLSSQLMGKLGIRFNPDEYIDYPVGSMFWARREALKPLLDLKLSREDFPEEHGQTDGTLQHTIERSIAIVGQKTGFKSLVILDRKLNIFSNQSNKNFHQYISTPFEMKLRDSLSAEGIVSFDIFDTLLIRPFASPDMVFDYLEGRIDKEFGIKRFHEVRKNSENIARARKNFQGDIKISEIYSVFSEVAKISTETAKMLLDLEVRTERELLMPRESVIKLAKEAKDLGKKIILVTDTYLEKKYLENILQEKCINFYDVLYISCESASGKTGEICGTMFSKARE